MSNRKIKFRAWDQKNKNMSLPFELFNPVQFRKHDFSYPSSLSPDDFIIQQFTGLIDKKGNEIYEGDIISFKKYGSNSLSVIKWCNKNRCGEYGCVGWAGILNGHYDGIMATDYKIVGNVYENPELVPKNED